MTPRERYSTNAPWEPVVGYSRAIRVGNRILVAGTTAIDETASIAAEKAYDQAVYALEKCVRAVEALGGRVEDVVLTRMYVVNLLSNRAEVGRAHRHVLGEVMPVSTMVGISALVDPRLIVEVEMEAVVE